MSKIMELREKADKVIHRQSRQISGMTIVLLVAYLIQLAALLFLEKDVVAAIPLWFQDRYRNVQCLSQCIGDFYQHLYLKMTMEMPTYATMGILILISITMAVKYQ